uniref:Uncharacterized protein n=1 Tax=Romanomermis culicivorax TaxID=13658 RepID=A0A915KXJ6_ROMCU
MKWEVRKSEENTSENPCVSCVPCVKSRILLYRLRMLASAMSSMELEKVRQSWENDFLSRPSWCDASLALAFIEAGHADGNVRALKVRLWIQKILFGLGCFIQRNFILVLVLGIINLATFSLGLLNLRIETNIEKLWVDTYGQLHGEMEHGRRIFFNISNPPDEIYEWYPNFDFTSFSPFVILIQTGKNEGDDVLKPEDLLEHADVLVDIASMQVKTHSYFTATATVTNQTAPRKTGVKYDWLHVTCTEIQLVTPAVAVAMPNWTLGDVCRKASMIDLKDQTMFQRPAAMLIPCIIITPLDCFWDGAKPLGPFENMFDDEMIRDILRLSNGDPPRIEIDLEPREDSQKNQEEEEYARNCDISQSE